MSDKPLETVMPTSVDTICRHCGERAWLSPSMTTHCYITDGHHEWYSPTQEQIAIITQHLATVTAERDRLKRLVESAVILKAVLAIIESETKDIHFKRGWEVRRRYGRWFVYDYSGAIASEHETAIEAIATLEPYTADSPKEGEGIPLHDTVLEAFEAVEVKR